MACHGESDVDYILDLTNPLMIPIANTEQSFNLTPLDDTEVEGSQTLVLLLTNLNTTADAAIGDVSRLVILEDDELAAGELQLSPSNVTVDEDAGSVIFTVTRSRGSSSVSPSLSTPSASRTQRAIVLTALRSTLGPDVIVRNGFTIAGGLPLLAGDATVPVNGRFALFMWMFS